MTSQIKIPLHQLDQTMMDDLKEKYPDAELVLELHPNRHTAEMDMEEFWQFIAKIDWTKNDNEEQLAPLVAALAQEPVKRIFAFDDLLSACLYQLDRKEIAVVIGEDAWAEDKYFSVDTFLYARACVIANGKDLFEQVRKNPKAMPKDLTYESILYVGTEAYETKTGLEYTYIPTFPIETYTNKLGWKDL